MHGVATASPGLTANLPCGAAGRGHGVNMESAANWLASARSWQRGAGQRSGPHLTYGLIGLKARVLDMGHMQPGSWDRPGKPLRMAEWPSWAQ